MTGRRGGNRRAIAALLVAGAVAGGALTACGSSGGPLSVGPDEDGQTVTVSVGQRVEVTLPGTTWLFTLHPAFGPVTELSTSLHSGRTSSAAAVFRADRKGNATVGATRSSCGARPCSNGHQDHFVLTVVVSG